MYASASHLANLPVISLQTGETAAWTKRAMIDMANFELTGFICEHPQIKHPLVLMSRDIRQLASDCLIIDNEDELADPNDIVRLKDSLEADYTPVGKPVIAESGRKLGSVEDFSINIETNRIQKIYVRQSLLKAWMGSSLIIDRVQIIDVTPQRITVRDATIEAPVMQPKPIAEPHP